MKSRHISILDSILRDGAQGEGLSFSLQDKLAIVKILDDFGIDYIEAGIPASNPKDLEFFKEAASLKLSNARLCAFGTTRHPDNTVENDAGLKALLEAGTQVVSIVGKASSIHVAEILRVTPEENLSMITDTVSYLRKQGKEVIFDAEHFFDGYYHDADYAMKVLETAVQAGANIICLCDTNGACSPTEILTVVRSVRSTFPKAELGIHCHNDSGCAVANSMLAVEEGVKHVQGTFNGCGERCGNADLGVLIPNLILKKNCTCKIPRLDKLVDTATLLAEISNVAIPNDRPYVGRSAFTHKGGMHSDGMLKMRGAFEHISPEIVGNHRRYLLSEVAGRSILAEKLRHFAPNLTKDSPEITTIMTRLKELEYEGYQFEAADASLEILARRELGLLKPHFELVLYKTIDEAPAPGVMSYAMIQVRVGDSMEIQAALGNGPVNALDGALRKALKIFYPQLDKVHLTDYKVRVLDTASATASKVRVLIDSTDGKRSWTTVGVSTDIIQASWTALADSIEYQLIGV